MFKLEKNIWNASFNRCIFALSAGIIATALTACSESFTDPRDGQCYDVVHIGQQTWMAENLNYDGAANTNAAAGAVTGGGPTNGQGSASFCPDGDKRNCSKYGRLYTWEAAQAACPEGWRLPTRDDFDALVAVAGAPLVAGKVLKSTSGWFKKGNGTDDFGFAALPAGYMSAAESSSGEPNVANGLPDVASIQPAAGKYDGIGGYAYLWSSTADESEPTFAHYLFLDFSSPAAEIKSFDKNSARSVRCIKASK